MWRNRTRSIRDWEEYLCLVALACVLRQKGVPAEIGLLRGREPFIALSSATGPSARARAVLRDERRVFACGRGGLRQVDALDVSASGRIWEPAQ
jgi:hypothetical protein